MIELQAISRILTTSASCFPAVLATLVSVEGSSYRRPGARLLLAATGERIGSISGGCLEEDILAHGRQVAASGAPKLLTYDTTSENDLVWGVGQGCHGIIRVLLEPLPAVPSWATLLAENFAANQLTELLVVWQHDEPKEMGTRLPSSPRQIGHANVRTFVNRVAPPVRLTVFGAGDDAQPLVRFAKGLGWHVTVADPRAKFATTARFPDADAVCVAPSAELVANARPPVDSFCVVMTHHYVHDAPILRDLLALGPRYIGLLGPKKRAEKILADISRDAGPGFAETSTLARLHAPVGLDLGSDNPEEVALSILAEMQAVQTGRVAKPLRERDQPIHG